MNKRIFLERLIGKKIAHNASKLCMYQPGDNYIIIEQVYDDMFLAAYYFYTGAKLETNLHSISSVEMMDYGLFE